MFISRTFLFPPFKGRNRGTRVQQELTRAKAICAALCVRIAYLQCAALASTFAIHLERSEPAHSHLNPSGDRYKDASIDSLRRGYTEATRSKLQRRFLLKL